ncbi:MAG: 5-carboxymethyl-2-hydroxymuconate Delta-isomerase [Amphritea sp.]
MPHCIIEYAKDLESAIHIPRLIQAVHAGALKSALFDEDDIKTRATGYEHYQTGNGDLPFVHVTAKILSGRSEQQKAYLSRQILAELKSLQLASLSLTVEVSDMTRETYAKSVT